MSNFTCSFINNKNIRCLHKVNFSITYCSKHKRCAKMNVVHSLLSLNKIQEKIKKVNEKNDMIQEMIKVAMQEVNQERLNEAKQKEEKLKDDIRKNILEEKLKDDIRKNILEDIQQEVTKFDKEHDKDVTQEEILEATQIIDQEEETLEATQIIDQEEEKEEILKKEMQEETLDIIQLNRCCFCNEECNPLSQACGRCARNRSMAW